MKKKEVSKEKEVEEMCAIINKTTNVVLKGVMVLLPKKTTRREGQSDQKSIP